MDVETAFLQGKDLTRDIFVKPPREANTDSVWKLNKSVYGLNEASKHWYERASDELTAAGMSKSKYDEALFYYHLRGKCHGLVGLHVDDFLNGGTSHLNERVIKKFRETLVIGTESSTPLKYIGLNLQQDAEEITVDQQLYLDEIEPCVVNQKDKCRTLDPPCS